jgi:hypothetical protein
VAQWCRVTETEGMPNISGSNFWIAGCKPKNGKEFLKPNSEPGPNRTL